MEQRRTQRYGLQLPLRIIQLGELRVNRTEKTRDISSSGVCFLSPVDLPVGDRIEYLITLSGANPSVRIRCLGNVLRSMQSPKLDPTQFEVAVTMERYQFVRAEEREAVLAAL